jgi:hypothetical protein
MRVISNASSTPKSLWGEAAHCSNTKTTPAVEFLGEKPDPDKLVSFGKKRFPLKK